MVGKCNVLVIDDSSAVRKLLAGFLFGHFDQVFTAESVEEGLERFSKMDIHVIVLDLIMPGIGGVAGIALLREAWSTVGIIAISGGTAGIGAGTMLGAARKIGAHRVLKKPFSRDELLGAVSELLRQGFGEDERPPRVLLVDDSRTIRTLISKALANSGYITFEAGTMEDALMSPSIVSVDLIITDIFMPGKGGIEGIIEIRENWPDVPIIAMSSGVGHGTRQHDALAAAEKVGANAVLKKPFSEPELLNAIHAIIPPPT